ncbi:MAG: hypothetical protein WDZ35_03410 [Crocinitomicaceae bacterium]
MNHKTRLFYKVLFGAVIIVGAIFFSFKYLMKGPPLMKVVALALIIGVVYLVINYIKNTTNRY